VPVFILLYKSMVRSHLGL